MNMNGCRFAASIALVLCMVVPGAALADEFSTCLTRLRGDALKRGISAATFDAHAARLQPDLSVLALLDAQPEFVTPIWDYLSTLVDEERVSDGQAMLERWNAVLRQIEARYGVDPATVVAIWGVESDYGRSLGKRPLLVSLVTLSCMGRRQAFFRDEFLTLLTLIDDGHVKPERLTGSWAGAFGQTQFMPSAYMRVAVDFDGDGRRDLVDSAPDALASTANFMREGGWDSGAPWGYEVKLPAGFDVSLAGRRKKRSLATWAARGLSLADGSPLPTVGPDSGLLLPAGAAGAAFLVGRNFDVVCGYNPAESYALAIVHLADRLRGGKAFVAPWPTDDPGLSRAERREVQQALINRGYDIGAVDGAIGERTREAIKAEQVALGLTVDGRAGRKLLTVLRGR
ncbi:lytic transglycosylase [Betaproteobacteria bacterium]|nr:lytic transglycosylase [Betaproteobacteria bacterium]